MTAGTPDIATARAAVRDVLHEIEARVARREAIPVDLLRTYEHHRNVLRAAQRSILPGSRA
ncbi:MAG: hypothetical protein WDA16_06685 [Candidatus Thermoplasmatota archaeon]